MAASIASMKNEYVTFPSWPCLGPQHSTKLAPSAPMTPPAPHGPPTRAASTVSAIVLIADTMSTNKARERACCTSTEITGGEESGSVSLASYGLPW